MARYRALCTHAGALGGFSVEKKRRWDTAASSRGWVMEGMPVGRSTATDLLGVNAL
jgi:hypothetical protein